MWFKRHKWKVILPVLVALILTGAFLLGGGPAGTDEDLSAAPSLSASAPVQTPGESVLPLPTVSPTSPGETAVPATPEPNPETEGEAETSALPSESPTPAPTESIQTSPNPSPSPSPSPETGLSCTISVSCATILNNMEALDPNKTELVPESGWILAPVTLSFTEGESVFDLLQRVLRDYGIHMEYSDTPIYDSAYIEGIGNLYEMDCGPQSGWMYRVNGQFPNYGCSRYILADGDRVEWVYTCDLGLDVGGGYAAGG